MFYSLQITMPYTENIGAAQTRNTRALSVNVCFNNEINFQNNITKTRRKLSLCDAPPYYQASDKLDKLTRQTYNFDFKCVQLKY